MSTNFHVLDPLDALNTLQAQIDVLSPESSPQTANTVLAGPTTGSAANPTFRAAVVADIPALPASQITSGTFATGRIPDLSATYQATAGQNTPGANGYSQLVAAPASAVSAGVAGQIAYDATHFYVCIATNSWTRATFAAW